jgi:hypothetical protein
LPPQPERYGFYVTTNFISNRARVSGFLYISFDDLDQKMYQYHLLSASFKPCNNLFVELMNQSTHMTEFGWWE